MAELILRTPEVEELIHAVRELVAVLQGQVASANPTPTAAPTGTAPTMTVPAPTPASAVPVAATAPPAPPAAAMTPPPVTPAVNPSQPPVPVAAAPAYTVEQIITAGATLRDAGKMNALLALLNDFGVQAVPQLQPGQLGAFATEMRKLGAVI